MTQLTLLDGERATVVDVERSTEELWLTAEDLQAATGWSAEKIGLCRGDVCVPLCDPAARRADGRLDLARVAAALHRPFAVTGAAVTGAGTTVAAAALGEAFGSGVTVGDVVPPLHLADLDGRPVTLDGAARRKTLLLAWASW